MQMTNEKRKKSIYTEFNVHTGFEDMHTVNQLVLTTNCSFKINAVPWTVGLCNCQWENFITDFLM